LVNSFRLPIHAGTKDLEQRSQHLKKSRHATRKKIIHLITVQFLSPHCHLLTTMRCSNSALTTNQLDSMSKLLNKHSSKEKKDKMN